MIALPLAHALGAREDLPIPDWLFAWGAAVVLIVSFVAFSLAWHRARLESDGWRPVAPSLSRIVVNPVTEVLAGLVGVFLLGVVVWSGLNGTDDPTRNFAVTFVFVTVWLGMVALSLVFGDVFRAFNPWRAIARASGGVFRLVAGQPAPTPLTLPDRVGRWPAVVALAGFVWFYLVYGQAGFGAAGLDPHAVAVATLVYTAYTLAGMALFGVDRWLERGEMLSAYFGMFARIAPVEVRDGRLGLRRPLSGLSGWAVMPGSVALVLLAIGATTFDGAREGAIQGQITSVFDWMVDGGVGPLSALRLTNTLFLVAVIAFVAGLFWAGLAGMHSVEGSPPTKRLGRLFAHAFVPIALGYLVAHYFSFLIFQGQAQFTYLLSDPLGDGSDLLGTASAGIDYTLIGTHGIWYVMVGSLVAGHVVALAVAHDRAIDVYGDSQLAARSQYWMLALMVGFTSLGLFLLSQGN
ncbi:MAG TPA: fenitrothion hydrolase [Solirubrobacterales bacterium]|nr:fenitrothion hydrolase [Solirubrobacterales bacterium]